jgi:hypothetical protein
MIAIAAALVTQPLRAGAIDTLVITEFDSTSLTATLNGTTSLTVTPNGVEIWLIDLTGVGAPSGTNSGNNWTEPDATGALGFVNNVVVDSTNFPNQLRVRSDFGPGFTGALTNNTQDTTDFTLNGSPLYVTFNDLGDVATAPDTGTTASLLGLSLTGLAFLRRKL